MEDNDYKKKCTLGLYLFVTEAVYADNLDTFN